MRVYELTRKGIRKAKEAIAQRDPIIDYLYSSKGHTATFDELASEVGRDQVSDKIRNNVRLGLIEEVS